VLSRSSSLALACALFSLIVLWRDCFAVSFDKAFGVRELYVELDDPYYCSAGLYSPLGGNPIPTLDTIGERVVYRRLLRNAWRPNCFLAEIGVYPLPLAGVAAKKWAPTYYKKAGAGEANIVRAVTESFDFKEPWSLSLFIGNMVFFKEKSGSIDGHGNIGMLCTYGYWHIKDNGLYPDHWGEFEWKIKVDKSGSGRQYGNSYRFGARIHSNPEIKNYFYCGLNRDRTDFFEPVFSFIKNTNLQVRGDCGFTPLELLSISVEAGKKHPFRWGKHSYAVGLSLGATWNLKNSYSGKLGEGFRPNSVSPIIRLMLKF